MIPGSDEVIEEIKRIRDENYAKTVPWFEQFDPFWLEPGEDVVLYRRPQVIFRADELRVSPSWLSVLSLSIDNVLAVENDNGTEEGTTAGYDKGTNASIWSARPIPRNTFATVTINGVFKLHVKNAGALGTLVDARLIGRAARDGT